MCVFFWYIYFIYSFIYVFLAVLGLHGCMGFFSLVGASGVYYLAVALGLLIAMTSLGEHRL